MPWCEACMHFFAPNALTEKGECPKCGRQCSKPQDTKKTKTKKARWHFILLATILGIYLLWRLIQGIIALVT